MRHPCHSLRSLLPHCACKLCRSCCTGLICPSCPPPPSFLPPCVQDIEFTVQDGRLFMLQTRNGKRTGLAALRVAVDMQREGMVSVGRLGCLCGCWRRGPVSKKMTSVCIRCMG